MYIALRNFNNRHFIINKPTDIDEIIPAKKAEKGIAYRDQDDMNTKYSIS